MIRKNHLVQEIKSNFQKKTHSILKTQSDNSESTRFSMFGQYKNNKESPKEFNHRKMTFIKASNKINLSAL